MTAVGEAGVLGSPGEIAHLIRKARGQDRAAFAALYQLTVRPVYRYLSARVNSQEEAEEMTREVFLAAMAGIGSLRAEDEAGLMGWLLQMARNKLADHLRRRYRRPTAPLEEATELESREPGPEKTAEAAEERAELREALDRLTPEQREVVIAKYVLGYNNQAVADLMGKNINSVNQLHHRALASLHRLLTGREAGK